MSSKTQTHCKLADLILPYWKLRFPTLILKYLNLKKNYSANVVNCKIYFKEVLVSEINGIINSDKFSHRYDDLYLVVTFFLGGGD